MDSTLLIPNEPNEIVNIYYYWYYGGKLKQKFNVYILRSFMIYVFLSLIFFFLDYNKISQTHNPFEIKFDNIIKQIGFVLFSILFWYTVKINHFQNIKTYEDQYSIYDDWETILEKLQRNFDKTEDAIIEEITKNVNIQIKTYEKLKLPCLTQSLQQYIAQGEYTFTLNNFLLIQLFTSPIIILKNILKICITINQNPSQITTYQWSPISLWYLRRTDELEHLFQERLKDADQYAIIPSMIPIIVYHFINYVCILVLAIVFGAATFINDDVLLKEILPGKAWFLLCPYLFIIAKYCSSQINHDKKLINIQEELTKCCTILSIDDSSLISKYYVPKIYIYLIEIFSPFVNIYLILYYIKPNIQELQFNTNSHLANQLLTETFF